jgi:hypothetical protein
MAPENVLPDIRMLAEEHPGDHRLQILIGARKVDLGDRSLFDASSELLAALQEYGTVVSITEERLP